MATSFLQETMSAFQIKITDTEWWKTQQQSVSFPLFQSALRANQSKVSIQVQHLHCQGEAKRWSSKPQSKYAHPESFTLIKVIQRLMGISSFAMI